jgi:hypothetical protein
MATFDPNVMRKTMKRLNKGWLAAAAMLVAAGAQASTGVLDFESFTITYETSGLWDQLDYTSDNSSIYRGGTYDNATGTLSGDTSGVKFSNGYATFGNTYKGYVVGSYGGEGTVSLNANTTYSIQAKDGWQLQNISVSQGPTGRYAELNGGTVSFSTTGNATTVGGKPLITDTRINKTPDLTSPALTTGSFNVTDTRLAFGNGVTSSQQDIYDSNGNVTGYTSHVGLANNVTPLTAMNGSFSLALSATTNNPSQIAYIAGVSSGLAFNVNAIRAIAPVPEPESYAMFAAGFGAIGALARRRSKKAA